MASKKCTKSPQDNILCCPICMDIYKVPRMLPCQHTLCETCLHSYIVNKSRERVLVSDFPCPVCRTSTQAPRAFTRIDTWASLFPLNHLLVSLLDSSFHELLEKKETGSSITTERCLDHSGKHVEFYCIEHEAKLCSKCFKNTHRQCEVLDIEEHIEFTSRFNAIKSNYDNMRSYLTSTIGHLKTNIEQLCQEKDTILAEVNEFRCKVEVLLTSMETWIKEQIKETHDGEVIVLKSQCEEYERIQSEMDKTEQSFSELPMSGNITQSLEKIAVIENEIKDHLAFIQRCHSNIKLVKLEFAVENQLLTLLNSVEQIGKITANRKDSSLNEPPELVVRECVSTDYTFASRHTSVTSEEVPESPISPEVVFISRQMVQSHIEDTTDQATASQSHPGAKPEHKTKEPKRPKTVPIETATPTPVVRPRPERPAVHGVPYFLPTLCSTPITYPGHSNSQTTEGHASSAPAAQNTVSTSSAFNHVTICCGTAFSSNRPLTVGMTKQRTSQYVNMDSIGDVSARVRNTSGDNAAEPGPSYRVQRSLSASSISFENERSAQPPMQVNRLQMQTSENASSQSDASPVYENTPLPSFDSVANKDRCSTFIPMQCRTNKSNFKQCVRYRDIVVKVGNDTRECTITGSVEMPDKRLLLVDCNNSKIKLFRPDFVFICHLDLMKEPWNVTAVSDYEIAVTVPLEKKIHIVRVAQTMSTQRCLKTRHECWGIAYVDKKFIITTKDDGNEVVFLDDNGRELHILSFASRENPNILRPVSITPILHENVLYVCCEGQTGTKGSLVRMSNSGDILYVFTHKDLDRPYCVASYPGNGIFVAAIRSSNVLMLSEGGASVTTVLSRDLGLNRPQHIHVTCSEGKSILILTERRSDSANVFHLKK